MTNMLSAPVTREASTRNRYAIVQRGSYADTCSAGAMRDHAARKLCAIMQQCRSTPIAASVTRSGRRSRSRGDDRARRPLRRPAPRRAGVSTTTSASSATVSRELGRPQGRAARSRRAPPRGARRGPPARLRRLRGRDPRPGSTARERSRSGIAAPTSWSRRRRTAASPSGSTASGSTGSGRSFRRISTDTRRTGSCCARTRPAPDPRNYAPMLATVDRRLPTGPRLAFEPKWDGYRAPGVRQRRSCDARSRNDNDLTARFPTVARAALARRCARPLRSLDGEVCALDETGPLGLRLLQQGTGTLVFVAFDLLERDGESAARPRLSERERRSRTLLDTSRATASCSRRRSTTARRSSRPRASTGSKASSRSGPRSPYQPGRRSPDWRKLKLEAPPGARDRRLHARPGPPRDGIGALVLGVHDAGGPALGRQRRHGVHRPRARPARKRCCSRCGASDAPFAEVPKMPKVRASDVTWVEPSLVAEVEFAEWTRRRASPGSRLPRPARRQATRTRCVAEQRARCRPRSGAAPRVLKLSNLDKPFWPEEGITKGDLLAYYRDVAPVLVPHLRGPAVHDEALSRRLAGQALLPEGRADAHAGLDPRGALPGLDARRREADDRLRARQRRARAALDGRTWAAST